MQTRRVTFRLYPGSQALAKLHYARRLHWALYNAAIANRRTQYERFGKSVGYLEQQNSLPAFKEVWSEYKELGSHTLQATLKRVDLAYQSFFKGLRGKPKFKPLRRYSGWSYPDSAGWKVHTTGSNGYLELRDLGLQIQIRGKARTWGTPTTCTTVYRNGKWFASITVNCEPQRQTDTGAVGVDFGTLTAIALSDGTKIENPRFLAKTQSRIRKASKQKRRKRAPNRKQKIKGSRRYKKAQSKVSKLIAKSARQRTDWAHKVTTQIVSSSSLVVTEKLDIKNMTRKAKTGKRKRQKTGLNRSMLDVGWGMIRGMLKYKEVEAEGVYLEAPTVQIKPSQRCPQCWAIQPKTLAQRVQSCACGKQGDRDCIAAEVCLLWAMGLGTSLNSRRSQASTSTTQTTGGWKQAWESKQQKPPAQH